MNPSSIERSYAIASAAFSHTQHTLSGWGSIQYIEDLLLIDVPNLYERFFLDFVRDFFLADIDRDVFEAVVWNKARVSEAIE
jgi:hypothetical protein